MTAAAWWFTFGLACGILVTGSVALAMIRAKLQDIRNSLTLSGKILAKNLEHRQWQ